MIAHSVAYGPGKVFELRVLWYSIFCGKFRSGIHFTQFNQYLVIFCKFGFKKKNFSKIYKVKLQKFKIRALKKFEAQSNMLYHFRISRPYFPRSTSRFLSARLLGNTNCKFWRLVKADLTLKQDVHMYECVV